MKIIDINQKKIILKGSLNLMYENLINELKSNPANEYTIQEAEELARRILKDGGYDNIIGPTPIIKIANNLGFSCFSASNMPEDISGNIFVGGTTKELYDSNQAIIVGKTEEPGHQRFIVAHELAHYLIDYLGSEESKNIGLLFSKTYPKHNHNSEEEIRADRFAAELLMPSELFLKTYIKAMEIYDYNKKNVISYLSTFFKTKKSCIERRIDEVIS